MTRRMPPISGRRLLVALIAGVLLATLTNGLAQAQTDNRRLSYGSTVTGTLNAQSFAQVYTFDAAAGDRVSIVAASQTQDMTLGVLITDVAGQVVQQSADLASAEVRLENVVIATAGMHYITVVRGGTAQTGTFTLQLTGTSSAIPSDIQVQQGITVSLAWNSADDLNLEVRDPRGGAVNFRTPTAQSGGRLASNVNGGCQAAVGQSPTETVSWPAGVVPGGSYEIIVYYNQACVQPVQNQSFTLTISVNGQAQQPITGTLRESQQYVTSFVIASPTSVSLGQGGDPVEAALNLIAYRNEILAPRDLSGGQGAGTITSQASAQAWSFQGNAGDLVTVDMLATSGSLDTFAILIGPDGFPIASNDDADANTRNSRILNKALTVTGRHVILATRFGLQLGGTEGGYTLSVTTGGGTPIVIAPTALPGLTAQPTAVVNPVGAVDTDGDGLPDGVIEVLLRWDSRADMRLLVRDPQGRVLYADNPNPLDGGVLTQQGNFRCENTVTNPLTYAYWPGSRPIPGTYEVQAWVFNECQTTIQPSFNLTITVNNRQVLTASGRPDFSVQRHHFVTSFTISEAGEAQAGDGGTFFGDFTQDLGSLADKLGTAQALEYGRPVIGEINTTTPFVVYTFQGNAGDNVRLSMRTTRGTLDPFMYLLDGTGIPLSQNDDVVPGRDINSRIDYTFQTSGTFVVVVTRYGSRFGGTFGNYELSLSLRN